MVAVVNGTLTFVMYMDKDKPRDSEGHSSYTVHHVEMQDCKLAVLTVALAPDPGTADMGRPLSLFVLPLPHCQVVEPDPGGPLWT